MSRNLSPRRVGPAAAAAAIAVGAMLVAGCSSGGSASGSAASGGATGSSASGASAPLSIRIPITSDLSAVPELVAIQQGYFAKNGLNVTTTEVSDTTTLPQLAGHTFDVVCIVPTQFISAVSSGIDLTAVSTETVDTPKDQTAGILVPKGSGITSMTQLQGKTIGTPSVTGTMILGVRKIIKDSGGNPDSINPVQAQASQLGDLLTAGKFQAITALQPVLTSLVNKGFVDLGDPFRAVDNLAANGMCAAPTSYVQAHPKLPAEYQAAVKEAGAWMQQNPAAAMKLYEQKSGTSAATLAGVPLPQVQGQLLTSDLNNWQNLMFQMGTLKQKINISAHVPS
jgi:NitT/TauT family transport system substrate-binding protein